MSVDAQFRGGSVKAKAVAKDLGVKIVEVETSGNDMFTGEPFTQIDTWVDSDDATFKIGLDENGIMYRADCWGATGKNGDLYSKFIHRYFDMDEELEYLGPLYKLVQDEYDPEE